MPSCWGLIDVVKLMTKTGHHSGTVYSPHGSQEGKGAGSQDLLKENVPPIYSIPPLTGSTLSSGSSGC